MIQALSNSTEPFNERIESIDDSDVLDNRHFRYIGWTITNAAIIIEDVIFILLHHNLPNLWFL